MISAAAHSIQLNFLASGHETLCLYLVRNLPVRRIHLSTRSSRLVCVFENFLKQSGEFFKSLIDRFLCGMISEILRVNTFFCSDCNPECKLIKISPIFGINSLLNGCCHYLTSTLDASSRSQIVLNLIPDRRCQYGCLKIFPCRRNSFAESSSYLYIICPYRLEVLIKYFLFSHRGYAAGSQFCYSSNNRVDIPQHLIIESIDTLDSSGDFFNRLPTIVNNAYKAYRSLLISCSDLSSCSLPCEPAGSQRDKNSKKCLIPIKPKLKAIERAVLACFFQNTFNIAAIAHNFFYWRHGKRRQKRE